MADKDYSATPLATKLGARPGVEVLVLFTTTRAELERRFPALKKTLSPADGLWVAWPKKASRIESDLDFSTVQEIGLTAGLVDNKSAAIEARGFGSRFWARERPRRSAGPREPPDVASSSDRFCESESAPTARRVERSQLVTPGRGKPSVV